jgi:hypothetical protein
LFLLISNLGLKVGDLVSEGMEALLIVAARLGDALQFGFLGFNGIIEIIDNRLEGVAFGD